MWRVWLLFFESPRGLLYSRFAKFCAVGFLGMLTDLSVMAFFVELAGLNIYLSNCLSFVAAVTVTFLLNKKWTFKDRPDAGPGQYLQFFAVSLGGLAWALLLLHLFVDNLHWWYIYAKLLITILVSFWNFIVNNIWTFRLKSS